MSFTFSKKQQVFFLAGYLFFSWANLAAATITPPQAADHNGFPLSPPSQKSRPQAAAETLTAEPTPAEQKEPNLTKALETEKATEEFLKEKQEVAQALEKIDLDSKVLNYNELKKALKEAGVQDPTDEQLESLLAHYASQKALEGSEAHLAFIDKVLDGARGKESSTLSDLEKKINERGLKLRNELLKDNSKLKEALDKLSHQSQSAQGFQLKSIMEGLKKGKSTDEYKRAVTKLSQWITPLSSSSRKEIVEAASQANADSLSGVLKTAVESRKPQSPDRRLATSATAGAVDLNLLQKANQAEKDRINRFNSTVSEAKSYDELIAALEKENIVGPTGRSALLDWAAATDNRNARKIVELAALKNENKIELRSPTIGDPQSPTKITVSGGSVNDTAAATRTLAESGDFSKMVKMVQKQNTDFNSTGTSTVGANSGLNYYGKETVESLTYDAHTLLKTPPQGLSKSHRAENPEEFNEYLSIVKNSQGQPDLNAEKLKVFFKAGAYTSSRTSPDVQKYMKGIDRLNQQQLLTLFNQFMRDTTDIYNACPSCWAGAGGHLNRLFPQTDSK